MVCASKIWSNKNNSALIFPDERKIGLRAHSHYVFTFERSMEKLHHAIPYLLRILISDLFCQWESISWTNERLHKVNKS